MPTTIFSQEVLRALALGSFPQSDAEKRKSAALVRSALRCRKWRYLSAAQLAMIGETRSVTVNVEGHVIRISKLAPYLHDLLGDVTKKQSRVIAQALKRGIDRKWADSTVARIISDKADIDPDRAKVIARTEMRRAKADISLGKKRDSAKVVFTLGNEDACPICRALEGKVFTVRKAAGVIPVHPNCILPGNEVECPDLVAAAKSFYHGPAVKITLLGGRVLTVTENHPILTPSGFLAAKHLRKGSQVLDASNSEGITKAINPDYHTGPTAIEEVFEALRMTGGVSSTSMPVASEDFHGDARFFDGEVDVVHANSLLGRYSESFFLKRVNKELFGSIGTSGTLNSDSSLCELCQRALTPANSVMGSVDQCLTAISADPSHSDLTSGGHTSDSYPHPQETGLQSRPRHTQRSSYFVERFAPFVTTTSVVKVERFSYQGHVYDLQADVFELYICNGVIVKNCYCFWSDAAKGTKVTRNGSVAPTTNNFRDSLLRFSALNQFCATGEGGGIDPTCSGGGTGGASPRPSIGTKFSIGGVEHEVSGYGDTRRTGPNKGRDPVLLKDAEGNRIVRYADELGGTAPEPIKATPDEVGKPGGKGTKSKTPKEVPQSGKTKFNYDDTLPEFLSAKTRDKMLASGELQYTEAKARAGDIESWHQDWYAEGIHPSDATLKNLKKTLPQETVTLYRGHPRGAEHSELESWTTDENYARDFAGDFSSRDLIRREVHPSEIVSDMSKINPDDTEVVVASGAYAKRMAKLRGDVLVSGSPVKVIQSKPTTNQFCATGEGGGIDPTCSPKTAQTSAGESVSVDSKVSPKRVKAILESAEAVPVTDEMVVKTESVEDDDYAAIEDAMNDQERYELDQYLEEKRDEYVRDAVDSSDLPEFDEQDWARQNDYARDDIRDRFLEDLDSWTDDSWEEGGDFADGPTKEKLREIVDEWYQDSNEHGGDAIDGLRSELEKGGAHRDHLQFLTDLRTAYDKEREKAEESWFNDHRSEAGELARDNYDNSDDRHKYLRRFHKDNPERFSGENTNPRDKWLVDKDKDRSLFFDTKAGETYEIWDQSRSAPELGIKWREIGFNDSSGSFDVTGKGSAVEVIGKASSSIVALLKAEQYDIASFTAAEKSRQKLYDRLTKTISSVLPEYAALAKSSESGPKRYVVVKKSKLEETKKLLESQPGKVEVISNAQPKTDPGFIGGKWELVTAELREEWFTEAGWADEVGTDGK
jgi:hypothetical protein